MYSEKSLWYRVKGRLKNIEKDMGEWCTVLFVDDQVFGIGSCVVVGNKNVSSIRRRIEARRWNFHLTVTHGCFADQNAG